MKEKRKWGVGKEEKWRERKKKGGSFFLEEGRGWFGVFGMFVCLEIDWGVPTAYCLEMWAAKEDVKLGLLIGKSVLRNFGCTWLIINIKFIGAL